MPRRFNDRYFSDTTPVAPETFNPIIAEFDRAIAALEDFKFVAEEQVALFNTNALKRFNDAIKPVVDQIRSAADGGFLVATTNDNVALAEGQEVSFYIPPEARVAFRPTPFIAILAPDEREDWAIGRLLVYNDVTGLLTVEILHLNGSGAQRIGWTVAASSGVVEAVYQWMTETKTARDATVNAASQALTDIATAGALIISAAEAARDAAVEAAEATGAAAILIAGGPVSSVNGHTGAVTGILEQAGAQDITGLKTLKIGDADDIIDWLRLQPTDYATGKPMLRLGKKLASSTAWTLGLYDGTNNAGTLDLDVASLTWNGAKLATEAVAIETEKTFVASGAISTGQIVALRSDGKVEVVSGTENFAAIGPDNTTLSVSSTFKVKDAAYNATSGKIALLYSNDSGSNEELRLVVATVSGGAITFGTSVQVASLVPVGVAKLVWDAAGTKVFALRKIDFGGGTYRPGVDWFNISGTTPSFVTRVADMSSIDNPVAIWHDDVHGSRVVWIANGGYLTASTYSNPSTFNSGTRVLLQINDLYVYDPVGQRFFSLGPNGLKVATISGTTITYHGSGQSNPGTYPIAVAYDPVAGKHLALYSNVSASSGAEISAKVMSFTGTTVSYGAAASVGVVGSSLITDSFLHYDPASAKFLAVLNGAGSSALGGLVVSVGTISGTSVSFSEPVHVNAGTVANLYTFGRSGGDIVIVVRDGDDFNRWFAQMGKIVSGAYIPGDKVPMRSTASTSFGGFGQTVLADTALVDLGHWNAQAAQLKAFTVTLPVETTNADGWIGQAKETVVDAANVKVKLRGSIASGLVGLTPGVDYYLKGDGSAITANNGRRLGRALSATEILMEAA